MNPKQQNYHQKYFFLSIVILLLISASCLAFTTAKIKNAPSNLTKIIIVKNLSIEAQDINKSLIEAEEEQTKLHSLGIAVTRYSDTLVLAQEIYHLKILAERNNEKVEYVLIKDKLSELREIKEKALRNIDELKTLEQIINTSLIQPPSPILSKLEEAQKEFRAERYEKSMDAIEKTYSLLSESEAFQTKLKAFYAATSRTILDFLKTNWKIILIVLCTLLLTGVITKTRIQKHLLKNKIKHLELRKISITELIKETQRDYFDTKVLSELEYIIRIKKYAEIIRDINRKIPLIKEELALKEKYPRKNNKHNKKDSVFK